MEGNEKHYLLSLKELAPEIEIKKELVYISMKKLNENEKIIEKNKKIIEKEKKKRERLLKELNKQK